MDGNGRWAKARGLPRIAGHQRGAEAVRTAVRGCRNLGIPYLTLYAFSSENWKRPASEVDDLMGLLRVYVRSELAELHSGGVRLRFIGERDALPRDVVTLIEESEALTRANDGLTLSVAVNYGSHREIIRACQQLAGEVVAGRLAIADIDETAFVRRLETVGIPDPDLLIRTSGEKRLSNFLLWQIAYSEFVFLDILWPDFSEQTLHDAVAEYHNRERRYGASSA
ncbi:MAG: di-trans,poly-cis-decaprenylcistransferase [Alphaproteobacteria bacterium]|nr:di-trans,poly-cis-decaprenylcistransferase [Alphaproteobacteria bacterium]